MAAVLTPAQAAAAAKRRRARYQVAPSGTVGHFGRTPLSPQEERQLGRVAPRTLSGTRNAPAGAFYTHSSKQGGGWADLALKSRGLTQLTPSTPEEGGGWADLAKLQGHGKGGPTQANPNAGGADAGPGGPVLDAAAIAKIAQLRHQRDTGIAGLLQAQGYDDTDFGEARRRLAEQRVQDRQRLRENVNRSGLFFSGQHGKQSGELETEYVRREGDARTSYDRRSAEREAARRALEGGYTVDEAAAIAEAVGRRVSDDSTRASEGTLALEPEPTRQQGTSPAPRAPAPRQRPRRRPRPRTRGGI